MTRVLKALLTTTISLVWWSAAQAQTTGYDARAELLKTDVYFLASEALEGRETGTSGARIAAHYIAARMEALGLQARGDEGTYFQNFAIPQLNPHSTDPGTMTSVVQGKNVIGYIDHGAETTVVIGAHYDHLGYGNFGSLYMGDPAIHHGADDNASGVSGLLHLAALCRDQFTQNNYLFIAFAGEERGLLGSNYFVKSATYDLERVNYMLNMDMIGRLNAESVLAINGVGTSPSWMSLLETIEVDSIAITTSASGIGPSDHTSFYHQGIPVLHFFTGQHEDYHRPSDVAQKINYTGLWSVMSFVGQVIAGLDDAGKLVFAETTDPTQTARSDFKVTLGVMPDYLYGGQGMRIDGVRPDRPADNAGLQKGDIILQMGGTDIGDMTDYMNALSQFIPGQKVNIVFERDGERKAADVTFD